MNIAIMTSTYRDHRAGGPETPYPEAMARLEAAGFDIQDLNLCSMNFPERNVFCGDDWEKYLDEVLEAKKKYKIEFCQSHPPYLRGPHPEYGEAIKGEMFRKMTMRALDITARIGAPWAVLHPVSAGPSASWEEQIAANHRQFGEAVKHAEELGIGVAFENMSQFPDAPWRFGCNAKELNALVDSFDSPAVGICWDFGHANLSRLDQPAELREMGSRLKVVHVADNLGARDDHFIPFQGTIRWEEIIPVLTEIGFPGA